MLHVLQGSTESIFFFVVASVMILAELRFILRLFLVTFLCFA